MSETSLTAFRFHAVDAANKVRSGTIEAPSRESAVAALAARGLTAMDLLASSHRGTGPVRSLGSSWTFGTARTPSLQDVQGLIAEWARCLEIGLTIADALNISAEGRGTTRSGRATRDIQAALKAGATLRQALGEHLARLPSAALAIIEAGERAGQLAPTLSRLAERLAHQLRLRAELRAALVYPAFVIVTALCVVVVLLQVVVPTIDEIIGDRRAALAPSAQLVLRMSDAFRENWTVLLTVASATLLTAAFGLVHPTAKPVLDRIRLRLPWLGSLIVGNEAAQFARALAAQIAGGVPIGRATRLAVTTMTLEPLRRRAEGLERKLSEGLPLSEALARDLPRLPRELVRFAKVGEQTGRLSILLDQAADVLEERTRRRLRVLTSLVTPVVTVVLGLVVGFIVLALMNAIVGLNAVALQ